MRRKGWLPPGHQKTCAYIPVDYGLKTDNEAWMQGARSDMVLIDSFIQSGDNRYPNPFIYFGPPALEDPDGPSGLIPGFTNRQAAIALAAFPAYPAIPEVGYHFLAGVFDDDGVLLYISAAGGGGPYGLHTLDLIASTDVTVLTFSFHPPEEVLLDFAHIDLFLAEGAPSFVWTPVRDWILRHTP